MALVSKALRKTEFTELIIFASFGIVRFSKFGIFLEKLIIFEFAKKFANKSSEISLGQNPCFWVQKPLILEKIIIKTFSYYTVYQELWPL